jgi:hypothetical protein
VSELCGSYSFRFSRLQPIRLDWPQQLLVVSFLDFLSLLVVPVIEVALLVDAVAVWQVMNAESVTDVL